MLFLAETISLSPPTLVATFVGAFGFVEGVKYAGGRFRDHNGKCKPGYSSACVSHLERLTAVEVTLEHLRTGQDKIEKKLDLVLAAKGS